MRAWIVGHGRMGRAVEEVWVARGHRVAVRLRRDEAWPAAEPAAEPPADVAFEFTRAEDAEDNVRRLLARGIPTVCGTTGWDAAAVREEADRRRTPLLVAPNFAVGVAVLKAAVAEACRRLAAFPEYEPALLERHHAAKRDAPSGTANMVADLVEALRGARPAVASLRHGGQPGEHRLIFEGPGEELAFVHRARSRHPFAAGAARAGEWLARERPAGSASFDDFLAGGGAAPEEDGPERSGDDG